MERPNFGKLFMIKSFLSKDMKNSTNLGKLPLQSVTFADHWFHVGRLKQYSFILINFLFSYNCLHFLPIPPPHPSQSHNPPPPLLSPPFCPCVLYSSSCRPLSPLSPPHSPVGLVTLFLISMSLVIFCLLCIQYSKCRYSSKAHVKNHACGPILALHLVLSGSASYFYLATVASSFPLGKEQLHLYSPKITFRPWKATTTLMC